MVTFKPSINIRNREFDGRWSLNRGRIQMQLLHVISGLVCCAHGALLCGRDNDVQYMNSCGLMNYDLHYSEAMYV